MRYAFAAPALTSRISPSCYTHPFRLSTYLLPIKRDDGAKNGAKEEQKKEYTYHLIILPLSQHLPRCLHIPLVPILPQHIIVIHNRLNKRLLEIPMDNARRLRRLRPLPDRPLPHLIGPRREEGA